MTSLRMRVVEAGARAIWRANDYHPNWDDVESEFDRGLQEECREEARQALDAMLDCLTENGVEWRREAFGDPYYDNLGSDIPALLAVLREPTEEER